MSTQRSTANQWPPSWPEITDFRVLEAMARLPREPFVPERLRAWAYTDGPLPIGEGQTISQPFMAALMSQALRIKPGQRILEIGTGSGYQTALLCELSALHPVDLPDPDRPGNRAKGETVYSVERQAELAQRAARILADLGYAPRLRVGDGALGWPEAAPFDAIMVTSAPVALPRPLWQQLAELGRMVIPIGGSAEEQILWLVQKRAGRPSATRLSAVRFVPLISPVLQDPALRVDLEIEA